MSSKDNRREYHKAYYEANKERRRAASRAWQKANKDMVKERKKAYRDANRDKVLATCKSWRDANRDKMREFTKAYREANPDKVKAKSLRQIASLANGYVANTLIRNHRLSTALIPKELIEVKRLQLTLFRLIQEKKKEVVI